MSLPDSPLSNVDYVVLDPPLPHTVTDPENDLILRFLSELPKSVKSAPSHEEAWKALIHVLNPIRLQTFKKSNCYMSIYSSCPERYEYEHPARESISIPEGFYLKWTRLCFHKEDTNHDAFTFGSGHSKYINMDIWAIRVSPCYAGLGYHITLNGMNLLDGIVSEDGTVVVSLIPMGRRYNDSRVECYSSISVMFVKSPDSVERDLPTVIYVYGFPVKGYNQIGQVFVTAERTPPIVCRDGHLTLDNDHNYDPKILGYYQVKVNSKYDCPWLPGSTRIL